MIQIVTNCNHPIIHVRHKSQESICLKKHLKLKKNNHKKSGDKRDEKEDSKDNRDNASSHC